MRWIRKSTPSSMTTLKAAGFIVAFTVFLLLPILSNPHIVHAAGGINNTYQDNWGTLEVSGSGWLTSIGGGVPIYSNGHLAPYGPTPDTTNYITNSNGVRTQTGIEWQCVELVNRLYLTKGWTTNWWSGYGYQMYGNTPSSLKKEAQGSITHINPGDVLAMSGGASGFGHVAIINTVSGSAIGIASQNTNQVFDTTTFSFSNGTINGSWTNYTIQGVIHAPTSGFAGPISFQANTGSLFMYTASPTNTNQGMLSSTSPSTATLTDGSYETAFVANTGQLFIYNSASGVSTPTYQSVALGTSPSIAAFIGGGWQVIFQGTDDNLHGWNSSGNATNFGQPMAPNTSPSIASLTAGGWRVAYQSNTNFLNLYSVSTGGSYNTNLGQGMAAHTSPSITGLNGSTWVATFQANTGNAYIYNSAVGYGQNLNLGMAANTNPSITSLTTSTYAVALQANTGQLWIYNNINGASNTNQGMLAGTSPSIAEVGSNYNGAFQANTGSLFTYSPNSGAVNTNQGMASGTNPAVALPLPIN